VSSRFRRFYVTVHRGGVFLSPNPYAGFVRAHIGPINPEAAVGAMAVLENLGGKQHEDLIGKNTNNQ
jgi:hypothetical protein